MGRLGVILGSNAFAADGTAIAETAEGHGAFALQRHGADPYALPHRIDHEANLRCLAGAGCDRVLGVGSVGSLRTELAVGGFACPDDFIALQLSITTFDDDRGHATAGFDPDWRAELLASWASSGAGGIHDGGVYWQANGPRFETPAEIRLMAAHAHLVGMTIASECIVAGELGLPYAALCVVDNLANGIGPRPLSPEELQADREVNAGRLRDALGAVLPELAR